MCEQKTCTAKSVSWPGKRSPDCLMDSLLTHRCELHKFETKYYRGSRFKIFELSD